MVTPKRKYRPDPSTAHKVMLGNAANRAAEDEAKLARAVRIVRAALRRGLLDPSELTNDDRACS